MNVLAFVIYTTFVTYISLRPVDSTSIEPWDKVGHIVIYSLFAVLGSGVIHNRSQYAALCAAIVVYGALIEWAQSFLPGRVMSFYDFLANVVGVVLGAIVAKWVLRVGRIR